MQACSLRHNIKETLESKGLIRTSPEGLQITGTEAEITSEAHRIGAEYALLYGSSEVPFFMKDGKVILNTQLLDRLERELNPSSLPSERQAELESEVMASMRNIMKQWGISEQVVDKLRDREGNPIQGVAAADLMGRAIQYLEGNEKELAEEVLHFYVQALKDTSDPLYSSMRDRITSEPEYEQVTRDYQDLGYTQEDIIDEAIAKVILKNIDSQERNGRWWKRVLARLKELFLPKNPFQEAALDLFRKDMSKYADTVSAFSNGTIMRSMGDAQKIVRDILVDRHSRLKLKPVEVKELEGKVPGILLKNAPEGVMKRYMFDMEQLIPGRATDTHQAEFLRTFGSTRAGQKKGLKSEMARVTGTDLHAVGQGLAYHLAKNDPMFNVMDLGVKVPSEAELMSLSKLNKEQFNLFKAEVQEILNAQKEIQKTIDEKGKIDLFTEIRVHSKKMDRAGTIDLMFLFSDASASVYDYKFISPDTGRVKDEKLTTDEFLGKKLEGYDTQMVFYRDSLTEMYGVTKLRRTRLVPGHVQFEWKDKKPVGISTFQIGSGKDRLLAQVPVAEEVTESDALNRELSRIYARLKELSGKNLAAEAKRERELLLTAVKELLTDSDLLRTLGDMDQMMQRVRESLKETDPEKQMSRSEMGHAHALLSMFDHLTHTMEQRREATKKEFPAVTISALNRIRPSINNLKEQLFNLYTDQVLAEREYDLRAIGSPTSFADEMISFSTIPNEIIQYTNTLLAEALGNVDMEHMALMNRFTDLRGKMLEWASQNGTDLQGAYEKLIKDTDYGPRLINMYSDEFRKERTEKMDVLKEGDTDEILKSVKWMKSKYRIRTGAKKEYEEALKAKKAYLLKKYTSTKAKGYEYELTRFEESRDVWTMNSAWVSKDYYRYLELIPEVEQQVLSPEYAFLRQPGNEALLEFYSQWKETMKDLDRRLPEHHLHQNMVPSVLADWTQVASRKGNAAKAYWESVKRSLSLEVELDEQLGSSTRNIPLRYLYPVTDTKGNIDPDLMSRDLFDIMSKFSKSAMRHEALSEVEGEVLILKDTMRNSKVGTKKGGILSRQLGDLQDIDSRSVQLLDILINMQMYGVSSKTEGVKFNILGMEVDSTKLLMMLRRFNSRAKMTFPVKTAFAALAAGTGFSHAQVFDNPNFGKDALSKSMKLLVSDRSRYAALATHFDIFSESHQQIIEREMKASKFERYTDISYLYYPLIPADRFLNANMFIAMLHNWAVDEKGGLKRLQDLPEGTKSLAETLETKDGKVTTKLKPEHVQELKMMLFAEMRAVTGNMSENEIAAYQSSIYLNIAMQFKTWMPGKFQNWIGEARYDRQLKRMTEGKYRGSLAAAFAREEIVSDDLDMGDKLRRMGETGLHAIKTLIDTSHYVLSSQERDRLLKEKKWPPPKEALYQSRKKRLMAEFNVFRSNTTVPGLAKTSSETEAEADAKLEMFMRMRQQSVRSTFLEIRYIAGLMTLSMMLGMAFDDEEITHEQRMTLDILARIQLEMAQGLNPIELAKVTQNGIPMIGLFEHIVKFGQNTVDVGMDFVIYGPEGQPGDKTGFGHYGFRFVPANATYRFFAGD